MLALSCAAILFGACSRARSCLKQQRSNKRAEAVTWNGSTSIVFLRAIEDNFGLSKGE